MSERITNILGYLTLFAILAAIWVLFGEDPAREQGARGEKLFTGLAENIEGVATIRFSGNNGGEGVNLKKGSDGVWRVQERADYPADKAKVNAFLSGLVLAERREPKTDNEERMPRIGLGSAATDVTVFNADGGEIAKLALGKRKESANGRSLTYVFKSEDTRSWLVGGIAAFDLDALWWVDKAILAFDANDVMSYEIGDVKLMRAEVGADVVLEGAENTVSQWQLAAPMRQLASLNAKDVQKLLSPIVEPIESAVATLVNGMSVRIDFYNMNEETWIKIVPSGDDDVTNSLAKRTREWSYMLTSSDADILLKKRSAYLVDDKTDN